MKMLNKNEFNGAVARAGMTNGELAKRIGMSKNTLSSRVNGKSYFDTQEIDLICDILNITTDKEKINIFLFNPSQNRDDAKNIAT